MSTLQRIHAAAVISDSIVGPSALSIDFSSSFPVTGMTVTFLFFGFQILSIKITVQWGMLGRKSDLW